VAGERAPCFWFVVSGCVRTYTTDAQGREHNLVFSTEGWWCTDSASFFEGSRSTLALQALEAISVLGSIRHEYEQPLDRAYWWRS
jgi:CRP-like cAMP-binding protein